MDPQTTIIIDNKTVETKTKTFLTIFEGKFALPSILAATYDEKQSHKVHVKNKREITIIIMRGLG